MPRRLTLPLFLLLPLLWLFRRALFLGEAFAFRDSSYYYHPFYQYVQQRWSSGVPLWNPLDGIGQPLLGDPTAAVFYPAKLLFTLPLPYNTCFAIYVIAHLLLGGWGAYRCARSFQATRDGAILAGIGYELSGHVLFQYCNPIYLVASAWLPIGWLYFFRIANRGRTPQSVAWFGVALSMMLLGGAAQMAMHCVLCAIVYCAIQTNDRRSLSGRSYSGGRTFFLLGIGCLLAAFLAAVQILPSKQWSARSERAYNEVPRSVIEVGKQYAQSGNIELDGLWKREALNTKHDHKIYEFSVGPWRWSELFWPNIHGKFGPISTRWIRGLPAERRMWSASLYLGLLPISLALVRFRLRRSTQCVRWLSWLLLLSLFASIGEYGMGWILDEWRFQSSAEYEPSSVIRGFGGLYWFLTVSVPSYVEFRYPAKWWTVTSLSICLLAAKGWPVLRVSFRRRTLRRVATLGVAALVVTMAIRCLLVRNVPPSVAFGPFDPNLAAWHMLQSVLHTSLLAAGGTWLFRRFGRGKFTMPLLVACAVELTIANGWMIQTAPDTTPPTPVDADTTWRTKGHDYPPAFRTAASAHRFQEARIHDLRTLMPKYHLLTGERQLNSISAMECGDYAAVWEALGSKSQVLLGATPASERAWLVYDWRQAVQADESLKQWTKDVLLDADGDLRDLRHMAVVESGAVPAPPSADAVVRSECEVVSADAERIEVRLSTQSAGLLVLREQYYPDWFASISTADNKRNAAKVYRVNRVMRGVFVPAGKSTVVLRYLPRCFYIGGAVSALAWLGVLAFLARTGRVAK